MFSFLRLPFLLCLLIFTQITQAEPDFKIPPIQENMKKIYSYLIALVVVLSIGSCTDSEYSDKYENPAKTATASCDKLMTGVFYLSDRNIILGGGQDFRNIYKAF